MGGVCSGGTVERNVKSDEVVHEKNPGFSEKLKSDARFETRNRNNHVSYAYTDEVEVMEKQRRHPFDSGDLLSISGEFKHASTPASKAAQMPSLLGKAGIVGLEKAVDVLDVLGSSMTNLNSSGFSAGVNNRANRICILAFEVANTVAKGSSLLLSLSEDSIRELKEEILTSEGVKRLVSTDMKELLLIAAADKREEFDVFSREVVRFGNLCKDPQWHNLDRFFSRLDSDSQVHKQRREEAETTMQELTTLAQHTSELYHELHALDRFEQDYRRKLEEFSSLNLPKKGECLAMLHSELKHQRKLVRSLKKKTLWSKTLEQVVEKLVDIVTFMHQEIIDAFGENMEPAKDLTARPERLGTAGLALHYASIVTQIDNIASRPTSLPPNMRDTLYNGLPPSIKTALRSRMQLDAKEELSFPEIKAEMEKTLDWLIPLAADTTRAHQGFGWVGEWANAGTEFGKKTSTTSSLIRLQTLYHADKRKVEAYILDLLTWLHRLVSLVRYRDNLPKPHTTRSPASKAAALSSGTPSSYSKDKPRNVAGSISSEDRILLEDVVKRRKVVHRLSKSQDVVTLEDHHKSKIWAHSWSTGSSPRHGTVTEHKNVDVLDVLDGLDSSFSAPTGGFR